MGERKVQAKYYPPDFDPSLVPRAKKKRQNDDAVRFMLPMSVRCETCGEFMGTGLKFNARKSDTGDDYLGIRIFRFTMKCKACPASFAIRTDPRNSDYACESGVRRNYEPWKHAKNTEQEAVDERARQDEDALQALENKTLDAKQELDDLDALDHIKSVNGKRAKVDVDKILASYAQSPHGLSAADERHIDHQVKLALQSRPPPLTPKSPQQSELLNSSLPGRPPHVKTQTKTQTLLSRKLQPVVRVKLKRKIGERQQDKVMAKEPEALQSRVANEPATQDTTTRKPVIGTPASLIAYDDCSSSSSGGSTDDDGSGVVKESE